MTTSFPGALDSYTTKTDGVDDVLAAHVNNLQDAMVAVETAIGQEGPVGLCEGRLTLATGTPVTTTDQTAKTTVYFTPYLGNRISLYDGTGWVTHVFTEKSVAVPATTNTPFDVFVYSSSGTVTLETLDWTNDTTRATALTTQDGVYVKTGATTRRYLGTGRTTGSSGQTEDSQAARLLYNYYNRVLRRTYKADATGHAYGTAAYRYWNNDSSMVFYFFCGVVEDAIALSVNLDATCGAGVIGLGGLGLNTVGESFAGALLSTTTRSRGGSSGHLVPALGLNYVALVEFATGASVTFNEMYSYGLWRG